jgi:hypothetical protein
LYSIDLEQFSLDEFSYILTTMDLLPGRRILLNNLPDLVERVKHGGINHLAALQKVLKNKKQYPDLASAWSVSVDYLTVLNREINGYLSKPYPLSDLFTFSEVEIESLERNGLKTTKDLYDRCAKKTPRRDLAERLNLPEEKLMAALELTDLLRINGVGPTFARILRTIGIRNGSDYLNTASQDLLARFLKANEDQGYTQARLGIKDIEYCKRFCKKLTNDIEY